MNYLTQEDAHEYRQRSRDKRLEKLEQQRTSGEFDWDPDEEFYQDEEDTDDE
jgi:hypothetical protein